MTDDIHQQISTVHKNDLNQIFAGGIRTLLFYIHQHMTTLLSLTPKIFLDKESRPIRRELKKIAFMDEK